jgi:DNA-binding NarL/FixJ family response regulator
MEQKQEKRKLENLKELNKKEYEHLVEICNFTDRQKEIFSLKNRGFTTIQISMYEHKDYKYLPTSESTVKREWKRIKNKIIKNIGSI